MANVGDLFSLSGRTAVVTGASSGIGRMIAKTLLMADAIVWIVARNASRLDDAATALAQYGPVHAFAADITQAGDIEGLRSAIFNSTDSLSILVNNAGMTTQGLLGAFPGEHWDALLELNPKAPSC